MNTASVLGLMGAPRTVAYCTSKFGVVGLSEALDLELRPEGIRVLTICPGIIDTDIVRAGRVNLPSDPHGEGTARFYARFGARPETVGEDVVRAVLRRQALMPTPAHARWMWRLRRRSLRLQQTLALGLDRVIRGA